MNSNDEELHEKFALLEEHDRLNKSLAALSRHFAHVQLRLQQVVSAPTAEDREVIFFLLQHRKNNVENVDLNFIFRNYCMNCTNLRLVEFQMSCVNRQRTSMSK